MKMRRVDNSGLTENRDTPKEGGTESPITVGRRAWFTLALLSRHTSDGIFLRDHASSCDTRNHTGL